MPDNFVVLHIKEPSYNSHPFTHILQTSAGLEVGVYICTVHLCSVFGLQVHSAWHFQVGDIRGVGGELMCSTIRWCALS